jgi:hypothetical protein
MDRFPPGGWEFSRPPLSNMIQTLESIPVTKAIHRTIDTLWTTAQRVGALSRTIVHDEESSEDNNVEEHVAPSKTRASIKSAPKQVDIHTINSPPVSIDEFLVIGVLIR